MLNLDRLVILARCLSPGPGVFVEAGANDGLRQSNTLRLEKEYGWSGLLIEPSPAAYLALGENRPTSVHINAALVSASFVGESVRGAFSDGQLTGTLSPELVSRASDVPRSIVQRVASKLRLVLRLKPKVTLVEVPALTLAECLEESGIKTLNLLSLDVEGYELEVLQGLNLDQVRPQMMIVEVRSVQAWDLLQWCYAKDYCVVEKISNFADESVSGWTGDHEDYVMVDRSVLRSNKKLSDELGL